MDSKQKIVTHYIRMWPREVFDVHKKGGGLVINSLQVLRRPGVYILYRDDIPYYVGKADKSLYSRLHTHANMSTSKYFNFWNFFSCFVVPDTKHIGEVEGILIAAMPTANSSTPRIARIKLPKEIGNVLRDARRKMVNL